MNEATARRITLVRAFDGADSPLWTAEDATWATRLAAQSTPAQAPPAQLLADRAEHALQRLAPRDPAIRRWLARPPWRWVWLIGAALVGAAFGLAGDLLGPRNWVDILAPAAWALVAWNALVFVVLLVQALRPAASRPGLFKRALLVWWQRATGAGPLRQATLAWAELTAPLAAARVTVLLHVAAAALAAGLVGGMYLRGLVFDYRAAWQSTFLDAAAVHQGLGILLAPASQISGIALPPQAALEALRLTPAQPVAQASAAPWIHLYAVTLGAFVVLPRLALALWALLRAAFLARRLAPPLDDPYVSKLMRRQRGGVAQVLVLPYAAPPGAQAALNLRAVLATELGDDMQLRMADVTAVGDEESSGARAPAPGAALAAALVDLGATPEVEAHGRFLQTMREAAPSVPLLLVADEAAFARRFGNLPGRLDERRGAWRSFAAAQGVDLLLLDLERPDVEAATQALRELMSR